MSPELTEYVPDIETEMSLGETWISPETVVPEVDQQVLETSAANELSETKGGEAEKWELVDAGAGYRFENGRVINTENGAAWDGFDAETIAQLEAGDERVRLPDWEENNFLYVTHLLQDTSGNISYEIRAYPMPANDTENELSFDGVEVRFERAETFAWQESFAERPVRAEHDARSADVSTATEQHPEHENNIDQAETPSIEMPLEIVATTPVMEIRTIHAVAELAPSRAEARTQVIAEKLPVFHFPEERIETSPVAETRTERSVPVEPTPQDQPLISEIVAAKEATSERATADAIVHRVRTESTTKERGTVLSQSMHHEMRLPSEEIQQAVHAILEAEPLDLAENPEKPHVDATVAVEHRDLQRDIDRAVRIESYEELVESVSETVAVATSVEAPHDIAESSIGEKHSIESIEEPAVPTATIVEFRRANDGEVTPAPLAQKSAEALRRAGAAEIIQFPRARAATAVDERDTAPRARRSRNGVTITFAHAA